MTNGKKLIIAILLIAALADLFFVVNNPTFNAKMFLGVPYNPFVIYFYFFLLTGVGVVLFDYFS